MARIYATGFEMGHSPLFEMQHSDRVEIISKDQFLYRHKLFESMESNYCMSLNATSIHAVILITKHTNELYIKFKFLTDAINSSYNYLCQVIGLNLSNDTLTHITRFGFSSSGGLWNDVDTNVFPLKIYVHSWNSLEIYMKQSSDTGFFDGIADIRLNGNRVFYSSTRSISIHHIKAVEFRSSNITGRNLLIDDVIIDDTNIFDSESHTDTTVSLYSPIEVGVEDGWEGRPEQTNKHNNINEILKYWVGNNDIRDRLDFKYIFLHHDNQDNALQSFSIGTDSTSNIINIYGIYYSCRIKNQGVATPIEPFIVDKDTEYIYWLPEYTPLYRFDYFMVPLEINPVTSQRFTNEDLTNNLEIGIAGPHLK